MIEKSLKFFTHNESKFICLAAKRILINNLTKHKSSFQNYDEEGIW